MGDGSSSNREVRLWDFLPAVLVAIFVVAFAALHLVLNLGELGLVEAKRLHMEFGVAWGVAELLLLMALISSLVYGVCTVRAECQRPPALSPVWPRRIVGGISAVIVLLLVLSSAGGKLTEALLASLDNIWLDLTVHAGNFIGGVVLAVTATAVSLIGMFRGPVTVEELADKMRRFSAMLWLSAAVVVFALLEIYLLYRWGVAASSSADNEQLNRLMTSLSLGAGGVGTALLIVIFAPAAFALDGALGKLKAEHYKTLKNDKDMAVWLSAHGLDSSPVKSVWTLLAVFGPILSGIAQNAITRLLGAG